jgi:hypothetical protein
VKRSSVAPAPPARGPNKRRRAVDDDMGRDDNGDSISSDNERDRSAEEEKQQQQQQQSHPEEQMTEEPSQSQPSAPHTPKRSRIAPEVLPLGLERSDYHELHASDMNHNKNIEKDGTDVVVETDGETWSTEEDRMLVELVLEKLRLSKSDWQDCARTLGKKDRGSVGRRWKSLMANGDVGLKRGSSRRPRIHGTWR